MRILICKRAFTIGDPRSLPPHSLRHPPWPLIHTCTSEIPANYNRACLTCATVWFINHRLATGRSRIFSHRRSAVIFSVGIHVVIFMSKCAASHYPQPSLANPRRSTTPSRTSNADRRWASRLMRSANGSMETRNDRLVRDGQWLLSLSANLCKLSAENARPLVRSSAFDVRLSVWPRRGAQRNGETEEGNRKPVGPCVIFAPAILIVIPRFYSAPRTSPSRWLVRTRKRLGLTAERDVASSMRPSLTSAHPYRRGCNLHVNRNNVGHM